MTQKILIIGAGGEGKSALMLQAMNGKIMEEKIKAQIRQTNIQNLNDLTEEQKFEFQKALENELETENEEIQILIKDINSSK